MSDKKKPTIKKASYIYSVGRRKRAIARIRLYPNSGSDKKAQIVVNDQPIQTYFRIPGAEDIYLKPLELTKTLTRYRITIKVLGSGQISQIKAIAHGIARALVKADEDHKPILRQHDLLTRDSRKRQRRMIGTGGKARRKKQSPKR